MFHVVGACKGTSLKSFQIVLPFSCLFQNLTKFVISCGISVFSRDVENSIFLKGPMELKIRGFKLWQFRDILKKIQFF